MKQPDFLFMRKYPVDLKRYLPAFLFRDPTLKNLEDTLSREHEQYRLKLAWMASQFFLETCDETGLKDWETFLGISSESGQTFEVRKAVARQKLRGAETMTIANTIKLMENFMTSGFADVEELGDFELRLVLDNGVFAFKEMFQALLEYLPAHLDFSIKFNDHREQQIYFAQVENVADREILSYAAVPTDKNFVYLNTALQDVLHDEACTDFSDLASNKNVLHIAANILDSSHEEFLVDDPPAKQSRVSWDWYLWENWLRYKHDPFLKEYFHHFDEGELIPDVPDPDEPEIFPEGDFLRLYFMFPQSKRLRYLTVYDPRDNVTGADINSVGYYSAAHQTIVNSSGIPTSGIARALLITKTVEKIL